MRSATNRRFFVTRVAPGLLAVAAIACSGTTSPGTGDPPPGAASMNQGSSADTTAGRDLDLRLEAVTGSRPGRTTSGRNPFRFGSQQPVPDMSISEPEPVFEEPGPAPDGPVLPGLSPARPPLRFIGIVEAPSSGLIAVLTDGEVVFQGRQGETVEGRYRILRVAAERVVIELLPAGGRQVLALEGL